MSRTSKLAPCAALVLALAVSSAGAAGLAVQAVESRDLARVAASLPVSARIRIDYVQADVGGPAVFLLERFAVFADDAQVVVHGTGGDQVLPAPANAYFRGTVEGEPGSRVFLAVLADGTTEGVVTRGEDTFLIGGDDSASRALQAPLELRRVDPVLLKASRQGGFACGNEELPHLRPRPGGLELKAETVQLAAKTGSFQHTARVAVETDNELYALFNDTTAATNYVGNLIGYASTIYVNEINTSLLVQSVSLWTTSNDPWTQTNTFCGLMEFGRYWNLNRTNVPRTIAHFLSGKGLGGGIAWIGVLCSGGFGYSANCPGLPTDAAWGGGYGFTASISGAFNVNNPTVMWDIVAVTHEIGHNFNSPHTHCYNGVGGNASPIDHCRSGEVDTHGACYSDAQSLPGLGTAGGGSAGNGNGTIMSYCHLIGGFSSMSLNFGTGHPYGVAPSRVPTRMSAHVASVASTPPGATCLAPFGSIFANGFEGGTLPGAWAMASP